MHATKLAYFSIPLLVSIAIVPYDGTVLAALIKVLLDLESRLP